MYEWTSLDHVALERILRARERQLDTAYPFDFFHINSINLDPDGSLLISGAQHLDGLRPQRPQTGRSTGGWGASTASFAMGPGTAHRLAARSARARRTGRISIFDNGASPTVHSQSRGIVARASNRRPRRRRCVSRIHAHAALICRRARATCRRSPTATGSSAGARYRTSPSSAPRARCCSTRTSPPRDQSYRDLPLRLDRRRPRTRRRSPCSRAWRGRGRGAGTVYASWNGATLVASWRVLAGAAAHSLRPVAQAPRSGFETAIALPAGTAGRYLAVQALGAAGQVLGGAATVAAQGL